MRAALAARDMGSIISIFRRWTGASQTDVGVLLGMPQPHVSDFERGIRHATSLAMFERLADGLGVPRPLLGLADPQSDEVGHGPGEPRQEALSQRASAIESMQFVEWIAEHSKLSVRDAYDRVVRRIRQLRQVPERELRHNTYLRGRVTREQLARALAAYYPPPLPAGHAFYQATVDGTTLQTTVVTRPSWLGLQALLGTEAERFEFKWPSTVSLSVPHLTGATLDTAIDRLAAVELSNTVLTTDPVYRLLHVAIERERLEAEVTLMNFADYALTMDLLESELVHALADQGTLGDATPWAQRLSLPLRDAYLPSVLHALDVKRRICAGGVVALLAAARPTRVGWRAQADYALLVQERSPRVLNAVGKLAVIPKAFHQPTVEPAAEAHLSASLRRELEEELLGREELGTLFTSDFRKVDPFHAELLSAPLRWLLEHQDPAVWRMECVGFGINLLSGNYEFACLILIEDDEWWARFGSQIETNWEIERIRLYSSRDPAGLRELMLEPKWSNEGLFAFCEGLRRLAELDTSRRVVAPAIDVGD
jgi:transcriptional regulator with XRE-family HTH domain